MKSLKIANASQITEQLWIGGELSATNPKTAKRQLDELRCAGVDAIVDCRIERDDLDWVTEAKPQIDYLYIGVEDAGFQMPDDWFDDGTTYALEQIHVGHVVLSHWAGINRGPSMGFAILIAQGWDPIEASTCMKASRPIMRAVYAEQAVDWWSPKNAQPLGVAEREIARIQTWRAINQVPGIYVDPTT
ncbi:dual specificity protein phosphatase [Agreia sp. Leaf283]|uniref:dual specificity protein phosphatase family protein n=1 Tax=Agreia sp. Leaf283 TaxID=1736321 RepID=UPI0012F92D57|nr:dual specificity protein phosphatase [Agreia sp. Leaf283]